jgi:predicted MFS family arabinose efflux permease
MFPIYLIGLSWLLPTVPMNQYLTLILKDVGYGTFTTNLLTIPAYCFFILNLLFWCFLSEKLNERFLLCTISQIWVLPLLVALEVLPDSRSPWATWILSALIYAEPYVHPLIVAITSRNAGTVRTRTVASALYNMMVQTSNIIGSNVGAREIVWSNQILLTTWVDISRR